MFRYNYGSSSENSDSDIADSFSLVKTIDLSYSANNNNDARRIEEDEDFFDQRQMDITDTLLLVHNTLNRLPVNISRFMNLKTLDISNNQLKSIPDCITKLPLVKLLAKNNQLNNESLPKSFQSAAHLKVVNFSGNNLTTFPKQLLDAKSIEYLYLGSNEIGDVPNEIGTLTKLKMLCMGGNKLTNIPTTVGNLSNLQGLILSDNSLDTLPSSIANLKNLKSLLIHKNQLRTLPTEIIALKGLSELSLRENPLVINFVSDMLHTPPSLLELAGRVIKLHNVEINDNDIPVTLQEYLRSAHRCVNPKCKGVFFDNRVEHIKFVDFCGKYRVPLLQYLCSSKCVKTNGSASLRNSYADSDMMRKVLLG